jgi:hypothetical protein
MKKTANAHQKCINNIATLGQSLKQIDLPGEEAHQLILEDLKHAPKHVCI